MKEKELSKLDLEELRNREKSFKFTSSILISFIAILIVASLVLTYKKGFNIFSILPIIFLPIIIGIFQHLRKIKNEIKART